ncbi:MAG: TraB/GumN family protein [Sphingomonas sp.]|uniref:TraB/GumN family protein n=1 Tax=Sphingomonas sp. TaxID=28214 RepID=UPI0017E0AD96|nr:TraB/GumN family protein [Sphingomonas sp.]MBA3666509.1 TraB/GumN family protein [Sphingomonas sp.]
MRIWNRVRNSLAALGMALFASGAGSATPPTARPAMWKVADADTTIYLFGTIHLLPPGTKWRSPAFDAAAAGSDTLVVETLIDEKHPETTIGELFKLAVSPGLPPLAARVKPARRAALAKAIANSGLPARAFDRLETWAAGFLLLGAQFKAIGLDSGSGVETALKQQFEAGGKSIAQLETNAEQLSFFDKLSEATQREFLDGVLDDPATMKAQFGTMLAAWSKGNVAAMAKSFNDELDDSPEMLDALLARRNANWARWVTGRLAKPGTVLVAVGAGHLAGDKSVVKLLQKQGVNVRRIQ